MIQSLMKKRYGFFEKRSPNAGSTIDASFVEVPRQRNTREENKQIKEGKTPAEWKANPANTKIM